MINKHKQQAYLTTNHSNQHFPKANNEKYLKILVRKFQRTPSEHEIPNV